ncbi:MAG: aldehyde ferredoxin oxidoreductase family protein [Desulfurococcaceae archaeon]|nr:aldehyde ferredoxin oxidoreductase family protein [Desulfurococcaceae archaeon]
MVYPGKVILRVDLSSDKVEEEELTDSIVEKFVGGKGLAAYLMYREIKPGIDPFSPENKLFIFAGPLAFIYPTFVRTVVASKSPLTGLFCDSYAGGSFAVELRRTGYIGVVIEGKSDKLKCLKISKEEKRLFECEQLRGKTTYEIGELFRDYSVLTIGPAGENKVRFASIYIDWRRNPITRPGVAGRGGLGAILGSKNLKAIVLKGWLRVDELTKGIDKSVQRNLIDRYLKIIEEDVMPGIGIGGNLPVFKVSAEAKILPTKNFQLGSHELWRELADDAWAKVLVNRITCPTCPARCGTTIKEGIFMTERIEYETVAMNGPNILILDRRALMLINNTLNALGMDTITTGNILAFITELCERGLLKDYKISWGEVDSYIRLIYDIAYRRGLGDLLAEGLARVAKILNAEEYALHVKGLEIPAYDPRGVVGMALAYATADRGGDHLRAWTVGVEVTTKLTLEDLVNLTKYLQDRNAALWTLIACDNIPSNAIRPPDEMIRIYIKMLNTLGFNYDEESFLKLGERIYNLTRMFNVREGVRRKDDSLPPRLHKQREDTGWVITREDFEKMLDLYYSKRGWSSDGVPLKETLERLGLQDL